MRTHFNAPRLRLLVAFTLVVSLAAAAGAQDERTRRQRMRDRQVEMLIELLQDVQEEVKELRREVQQLRQEVARSDSEAPAQVREDMSESVPAEFELTRRRQQLEDLQTKIRAQMSAIAREEVELEDLANSISMRSQTVKKAAEAILRLRQTLEEDADEYNIAGNTYTADQVRDDLEKRLNRYKASDAELRTLQAIQRSRATDLNLARELLDAMVKRQAAFEAEIQSMQSDVARQKIKSLNDKLKSQSDEP